MNFNDLLTTDKHEAGGEMEILHPATGEKTGIFLTIRGIDSRSFRADSAEYNRKKLAKDADAEALYVDLMVKATTGWRGMKDDGEDMPFSKEAVRKMYTESPAIFLQADRFCADRRNFTKG